MTDPGWRKYECPICKGQRVDREPKESQPPCKLCGHDLVCIDENYGGFMTAPCNLWLGAGALKVNTRGPVAFFGGLHPERPNWRLTVSNQTDPPSIEIHVENPPIGMADALEKILHEYIPY